MKKTRKMAALIVAVIMSMLMTMNAMAATIEISGGVEGQEYKAYKVFDVTVSSEPTSYAYTIDANNDWFDAVNAYANAADATNADGLTLTAINGTNPVKYNVEVNSSFDAAKFAEALNAVDNSGFTVAGSTTVETDTSSKVITVTGNGYYFVDSSVGALCALYTTSDSITVYEKNSLPSMTKSVYEVDAPAWQDSAIADIQETVEFKLLVNTGTNDKADGTGVDGDYVITDTLAAGMDFVAYESSNIKVLVGGAEWRENTEYTFANNEDVLTITLKKDALDNLAQNTDIVITYNAVLNNGAVVAGAGNVNTASLTYGSYVTTTVDAVVYTYEIPVFKFYKDGNEEKPLANATFTLSKNEDGTAPITFTASGTDYFVNSTGTAEITTDGNGRFSFVGLDTGKYYLTETAAPQGFNRLEAPIVVEITQNEDGTATVSTEDVDDVTDNAPVKVENKTGALLPSTGGIGTTVFYVVGGVLVVAAVVLLITRKRMNDK